MAFAPERIVRVAMRPELALGPACRMTVVGVGPPLREHTTTIEVAASVGDAEESSDAPKLMPGVLVEELLELQRRGSLAGIAGIQPGVGVAALERGEDVGGVDDPLAVEVEHR